MHVCLVSSSKPCWCFFFFFFNQKGIVHFKFIEHGTTVNQHCYLEILKGLRESVQRKRSELWPDKWVLHLDNAPAQDTLSVDEFLAQKSISKLGQPSYSSSTLQLLTVSKNKKCITKDTDLMTFQTSRVPRQRYCTAFWKTNSRNAYGSGTII